MTSQWCGNVRAQCQISTQNTKASTPLVVHLLSKYHYGDVIMTTIASEITSLTIVYQPFIRAQIKVNIKAPRHWPLCGEFTGTGEFPAQMASNAENVSIWWRHHAKHWHHNEHLSISNHRLLDFLFNRLFRLTSTKTSKPALLALCEGNPPVTGQFPSQRASSAKTLSIWWRRHATYLFIIH